MILRDHVLQIVLSTRDFFERTENRLLVSRNLCFSRDDIDWRQLSLVYQTFVVLELRARNAHRIALHLQAAQRKHEIPVRALHVRDRVDGSLAKLRVSQREILTRDLDLPATVVDLQSAPEWLRVAKRQRRRILRVQRRELIVCVQLDRREIETIRATEHR